MRLNFSTRLKKRQSDLSCGFSPHCLNLSTRVECIILAAARPASTTPEPIGACKILSRGACYDGPKFFPDWIVSPAAPDRCGAWRNRGRPRNPQRPRASLPFAGNSLDHLSIARRPDRRLDPRAPAIPETKRLQQPDRIRARRVRPYRADATLSLAARRLHD